MKRIFLVLYLLFYPRLSLAATENLTQLQTDARVLDLDTSGSRQRFSNAQITEFLNVGQREAVARSHCLYSVTNFTLSQGTTYYAMPNDFQSAWRVTIGNKRLYEKSPAALDGQSLQWESATGYPTNYFINFSSRTLMGFFPYPQQSSDTDTIKVEYYQQAADLSAGTDLPFNSVVELKDFYHMLSYYAASIMELIDGRINESNAEMALYEIMVKAMQAKCTDRPSYSPGLTATP